MATTPTKPACECLTVSELAARLGTSLSVTRRLLASGRGPGYLDRGVYVIPREMVRRYLAGEPGIWHPPTLARVASETARILAGELPAHPYLRRRIEAAIEAAGDDALAAD